ncbi:MAG: hypothetical protein ACXWQO_02315 [Bdellovibrionota bacterium]
MIRFYPILWAAVTLSSILAMPAFSATNVPAEPKPHVPLPLARPASAPSGPVAVKPSAKPAAKLDPKELAPAPKKNDSIKKKFALQSCANKVNGTYVFGRAPYGCDAEMYEDTSKILTNLDSLVFNEKKNQKEEITRYSTSMYRFIRDASDEFITKRNPQVSEKEKETFRRGIMALVHQESFWSHYRLAGKDGHVKVMKGDQDWSFGMMQIHGRWNGDMIKKYEGWTLKGNLAYGMDMYYQAWQKVRSASCVKSLDQRARAAYSVYNAGGYASCRWTNPDDKWARNDKGFNEKFTGQLWNKLIDKSKTAELPSPVKMACTFDTAGSNSCSADEGTANL